MRDSKRFLQKNLGLVARLVRSAGFYRPDGLVNGLAPVFADPDARIRGVHLYTFNQVATTEAWRLERLAALRSPTEEPASEPWMPAEPGTGWLSGGDSRPPT